MGAMFVPELEISEEESQKLTKALAGVNSFYASAIDPKMLAWVELMGVAGAIYGPRVIALMLRRKLENAARPRVAPLAGTPVQPASRPAPVVMPTKTAQNPIPQNVRDMFSDPTFVPEVSAEE